MGQAEQGCSCPEFAGPVDSTAGESSVEGSSWELDLDLATAKLGSLTFAVLLWVLATREWDGGCSGLLPKNSLKRLNPLFSRH